uniref:Reverse transcriptase domain-containing protein n=1 Tax=Tanacetum cinerariifolium TaxID=118510 RepID=A0A6L2KCW6_TANCI|nr:hypothetical protein [Tanacetum cinerariifolium]
MSTRSSARRLLSPIEDPEKLLSRRNRSEPSLLFNLEEDDMVGQAPPQGPIPDLHSMKELLQAPTDGVGMQSDSLNSVANGNFLTKNTQKALTITENKSKVQTFRNKTQVASSSGSSTQDAHVTALTKQVEALLSSFNLSVKFIQNCCETCGGPHPYNEFQAAGGYTQDGALLSDIVPNPWREIKAITIQSGIVLDGPSVPPPPPFSSSNEVERDPEAIMDQVPIESTIKVPPSIVQSPPAPVSSEIPHPPTPSSSELSKRNPHQPSNPYPSRLNKEKLQDKSDIQIYKFLQMFKKLHFNISLVEALALMPNGPPKKLPEKLRDPGRFLMPCDFHGLESCMALDDLGASINLMPLSVWKKLSLPSLTPIRMTLELATRSIAYLTGIPEDVCMKVGKFTFPTDFVVVNYDVDPRVPLILGRPFLRTV